MIKKFKTQINEIAETNIPNNTNIWTSVQEKINRPKSQVKSWSKTKFLRPVLIAATLFFITINIPAVQANLEDFIEKIGGVLFNVTDDFPDSSDVITVPSEDIPVDQILAQHPFVMPTYVPQGYELRTNARINWFSSNQIRPFVELTWDDDIKGTGDIFLNISDLGGNNSGERVGPDSLDTIEIAGQDVALITGGWYLNTHEWNHDIGYRLKWEKDELVYSLSFYDSDLMDEMILMVASMLESTD